MTATLSNPAPAQAPAPAAPATQPETKTTPAPAAPAAATPAATPAPETKKEGAAAEPAPETKEKPAEQQTAVALTKDDVKLPEGAMLEAKRVEEIISFANEKKLPKDVAQAIAERENAVLSSYVEGEKEKHTKAKDQWYETAKTDKEFGGVEFDKNIERGHRVIKRFFGPEFLNILEKTGGDVHPEVIRGFVRLGKAMSDDQLVIPGDKVPADPERIEDRFYKETVGQPKAE